jgi:uncharacterized phiE125 gp8 family phage protein
MFGESTFAVQKPRSLSSITKDCAAGLLCCADPVMANVGIAPAQEAAAMIQIFCAQDFMGALLQHIAEFFKMTPILLAGPAQEPVSLDEMRSYLRLESGEEDALVLSLIKAARHGVEQGSKRALMAQKWRLRLQRFPREGQVRLPLSPILSLDAARSFDATGAAVLLDLALFHLDESRLSIDPSALPADGFAAGFEADVTAGFGTQASDVPDDLRQAVRMLAAHFYAHRADALHEDRVAHFPAEIAALVAPWRRLRLM